MMNVKTVSGSTGQAFVDGLMDLDQPVQSRHRGPSDQVAVDAMNLSERVAQPYDARGFFLNLPGSCLIRLMTYLTVSSFRNLSETSKETHQAVMAIFQVKHDSIGCPFNLGNRFTLESLERDQSEISEKIRIFDEARVFTNDIMAEVNMTRGETRVALSYGCFEGSLYQFSLHLLSLKKAFEEYNRRASQNEQITLKKMFNNYVEDRKRIERAVKRGTAKMTDLFSLQSLVTPPEISQMRSFTELHCYFSGAAHKIPKEIYSFTRLTSLRLELAFQNLSADIQNLKQLTYLSLMSSHLQSLPPEIGELVHLRDLYLTSCLNLKNLPESIVRLKLNLLNFIGSGIVERDLSDSIRGWIREIHAVYRYPHNRNLRDTMRIGRGDLTRFGELSINISGMDGLMRFDFN